MTATLVMGPQDFRVLPNDEVELVGEAVGNIGAVRAVISEPDTLLCDGCATRVGWVFDCRDDPERLVWQTVVVGRFGSVLCEECADEE